LWSEISRTEFLGNSRAISTNWIGTNDIRISECNFTSHTGSDVVAIKNGVGMYTAFLEKSSFQGNGNMDDGCSVLSVARLRNLTLSNVNITDNNCTGIKLEASMIKLENSLNLLRNHGESGGGLTLIDSSRLVLTNTSKLRIIDNRADE
jgi:hypothetical protein